MKKQKVYIVTGACGYLGMSIIKHIHETDPNALIRGLYRSDRSFDNLSDCGVTYVKGDVRIPETLEALFDGVDDSVDVRFIHAAGLISISGKHSSTMFDINVGGTANIISLCKKHRVDQFVYVSSSHAIPELPPGQTISEIEKFLPELLEDPYSKSKAMASQLVLDAIQDGLPAVIVHPTGIIGPFDYSGGYLTQFMANYLSGFLNICVKGGYDFVDVRDVASATVCATEHGKIGQCYLLSNNYASILSMMDDIRSIAGTQKVRIILPRGFVLFLEPLIGFYFKIRKQKPLLTAQSLSVLRADVRFSHDRATKDLSYNPRPMLETLHDTVQFISEHYKIPIKKRSGQKLP